ncbi:MAG TPA: hypothetical protein VHO90_12910 [Bacteroidales bacterium]|nr:hypothetical protein [Bacteroidales bacterium]
MSERFEKYVKDHRDDFDMLEPDAALWNRIENKLQQQPRSRNLSVLWKAAAVLIIFGFSFWAQMQIENKPQVATRHHFHTDNNSVAEVAEPEELPAIAKQANSKMVPEFAETEKYYSRKVNSTMKELNTYLVKFPDVAQDMKKDLAELDSVYKSLKKDLGDNVAQEEIISAMIQNYRMKLQILEDIKNELMQNSAVKPNENKSSHEI